MRLFQASTDRRVIDGDCLPVMLAMEADSIDAIVSDPPYNLSFMGKSWDSYDGQEDAGFYYWLSGLIDGEGCFVIKEHTRGTMAPSFALKLRADERGTIETIRRRTKIGAVTEEKRDNANPMVRWAVQSKPDCQALVDILDKYPLRAKKLADFWTWRAAVCEWTDRPRGNRWHGPTNNETMAALRERLMSGRAYSDIPWSGNEFQDWCRLWAKEALRVAKPGAHLVAFGGTRTHHRLMVAIEDAGWEIRDCLMWLYGSGFPKSLDVSKAIDKARKDDIEHVRACLREARDAKGLKNRTIAEWFGFTPTMVAHWIDHPSQPTLPTLAQWEILKERLEIQVPEIDAEVLRLNVRKGNPGDAWQQAEIIGEHEGSTPGLGGDRFSVRDALKRAPASDAAREWQGWGTALKPAWEPIVLARKPLRGTVAQNVQTHGTGAINVDGCRVLASDERKPVTGGGAIPARHNDGEPRTRGTVAQPHDRGRWPANVLLDENSAALLDAQTSHLKEGFTVGRNRDGRAHSGNSILGARNADTKDGGYGDSGGASRFFYTAKASTSERNDFLPSGTKNTHATVKPVDLMRWVIRLVCHEGGHVLDPFCGSGSTGVAAGMEGCEFTGIELDPEQAKTARARLVIE